MTGSIEIRVRYCDCDPMGVVHHTVYPVWFEIGRTELLRSTGRTYRELEAQGTLLAVVRLEVRYRAPARYDDLVTLVTTLTSAGHVKIEHTYEARRGSEVLVVGATTLACLDRDGKARPLPEGLFDLSAPVAAAAPGPPTSTRGATGPGERFPARTLE